MAVICTLMIAASLASAVVLHEDGPRGSKPRRVSAGEPDQEATAPSGPGGLPPESVSPHADTLTFAAVGDIGSDSQAQDTLEGMAKAKPDMHVALGDLSYSGQGSETKWCALVRKKVGGKDIGALAGSLKQTDIARVFGVCNAVVSRIRRQVETKLGQVLQT